MLEFRKSNSDERLKTKDKILAEGLRQLNAFGAEKVSIRSIADALGISSGNLTYHFKNTDVIIYELYLQLANQLGEGVERLQFDEITFSHFYKLQQFYFGIMWAYRFLLIDFVALTRRNEQLKAHFQELVVLRRVQFRVGIDRMIQSGLLKEEWVENLYDKFILRLIMLSNAWISDAEVHMSVEKSKRIAFYADLILSSFVPFLTEKGLADYRKMQQEHDLPPFKGYQTIL